MAEKGSESGRRRHVETLFFMHDLQPETIGEILGVSEATVRDDITHVSNMLRERAGRCSGDAEAAYEEVAGLLFVARQAISDTQVPQVGVNSSEEGKAALYNAAARAFFLAGRLKQGRPE